MKFLQSPRVWAALLAVVFVLLGTYVPAVADKLDQAAIISAVVALVAFIAADSVAGHAGSAIFSSPRFWGLVISLVFIFVRAFVPGFLIGEELIQELVASFGAVSVGVSYRPLGEVK